MPMLSRGYKSIEVVVTNTTRGDFAVQAPTTYAGDWIQGEQPAKNSRLNMYNAAKWGVKTDDEDGIASANVLLTGLGKGPVTISFSIDENGNPQVSAAGNNQVLCSSSSVDLNDQNHPVWHVLLGSAG